jgi:D-alanine--poly(phosphoribitol) ligase subunit 2
MALTEEALIANIRQHSGIGGEVEADTPLFSSGMLDSVAMLDLIMFVEQQSGMDVRSEDVTLENFDSPAKILMFTHGLTV